jgi:AcrR family transcriptional regulator
MAELRARRQRKRPYHHGDLRRALVDQALRTIQSEGVRGLTLRSVGESLGVSRTALYRHFADKDALLSAVAGEGFRSFRLRLIDAWELEGRGWRGFEAMGLAYVGFAIEHSSHYRVMFGGFVRGGPDAELVREAAGAFQALVDAIVELQQQNLMPADEPVQLARFIWAIVHGIAMLAIDGQFRPPHVDIEALTRFAIERLRTGVTVRQ